MPYTKKEDRNKFVSNISLIRDHMQMSGVTAGDLNFMITSLCHSYMRVKGENYQTHCEIEGVLQHASKEFYRRLTTPYEDKKIEENGDIDILR